MSAQEPDAGAENLTHPEARTVAVDEQIQPDHGQPANQFGGGLALSVESLIWIALIVMGIGTRFWNLGYRALHHDESLHAYYSYKFSNGDIPYVHDPLMHGPFLFFGNAIVYLLFGASDATSRYLPALFGVILMGLPWLLRGRNFLGRWGAFAAGFMLLISPSFLYYTRYIRHDPYTAVGALLLCIAIFRYLERPQRRWIIVAFACVGFLIANHEIVFAIVLAFVLVLWGALVWGRFRPLVPLHLATIGIALLIIVFSRLADWRSFPAIPWEQATTTETATYYEDLLLHPLVISLLLLGIAAVTAGVLVMRRSVDADEAEHVGYMEAMFADSPAGSVDRGVLHAWRDRIGLGYGAIVGLLILVALFTTLFTNLHGLATMTYAPDGTLLYWLGQQNVRRGSQPWFYFITEAPQYEWLAIFFGLSAAVVTLVRLLHASRGGNPGPNLLFHTFLAVWFAFLFLVLSWAGEKMPWLIVHFTLPAILLGATLINEIVDSAIAWKRSEKTLTTPGWVPSRLVTGGLAFLIVILGAGWFLLASRLTAGKLTASASGAISRQLTPATFDVWWTLVLAPASILVLIAAAVWMVGVRRTAYSTLIGLVLVSSLFQVHAGFRLAYLDGDIAKDTLIYNTTSPDTNQLIQDLGDMSELYLGDRSMAIGTDNCTQWPLVWYTRDFPNASRVNDVTANATDLPPVIVGVPDQFQASCSLPIDIDGYTAQTYVLRWHEPEYSIYRNFAIAPELEPRQSIWGEASNPHGVFDVIKSVFSSFETVTDPEGQKRVFRLVMFRELPAGLNPYQFRVYIRNDVLPYYNEVRYGE
ncbi:MAG: flippase activity-associated protein Agl23 [Thermomicrobiales bacterium]